MRTTLKSLTHRLRAYPLRETVQTQWGKRDQWADTLRLRAYPLRETVQTQWDKRDQWAGTLRERAAALRQNAANLRIWQSTEDDNDRHARLLQTERELQSLRLTHEEQNAALKQLRQTLANERQKMESRIAEVAHDQSEGLLAELATPLAQLGMQAHLVDAGQPVRARDMVQVAKRLLTILEGRGVTLIGDIGRTEPFDPTSHQALMASQQIADDDPVTIRMSGVMYAGKVLKKAGVTRSDSDRS